MRLELTCVCSLNDFQLVMGLCRGNSSLISEREFNLVCFTPHSYLICFCRSVCLCVGVVLDFTNNYFSAVCMCVSVCVLGTFSVCMCRCMVGNLLITFFLIVFVGVYRYTYLWMLVRIYIYIYIYIYKHAHTHTHIYASSLMFPSENMSGTRSI